MKSSVGTAAIAGAAAVLVLLLFVIYHFTMGRSSQPVITPDNRPAYVKALQEGKRVDFYGNPLPAGQSPTGR